MGHAKVQLKEKVRGIGPIERKVAGRDDAEAGAIRGDCAVVRSALTDDGRPPLEASGLKLVNRPEPVNASRDRVAAKRGSRRSGSGCARSWRGAWRDLRGSVQQCQAVRTLGRRFRRDPVANLQSLQDSLINHTLPP